MTWRLRIVSANLKNGGADPDRFARLVEGLAPDVVAVQELGHEQAEALRAVMPEGRLEPARDHTGMGLALRRPGPVGRVALPWRAARVTEIAPPGGPEGAPGEAVQVLNVHIMAPHVRPFRRSFRWRREQLRDLEAYLAATPRRRRVLVGDLNATPLWPVYRRLTARLADAALEAARGNGGRAARTWSPWGRRPRLLRIDHALVVGLAVHACRVLPLRGSDHAALLVDLGVDLGVRPFTSVTSGELPD